MSSLLCTLYTLAVVLSFFTDTDIVERLASNTFNSTSKLFSFFTVSCALLEHYKKYAIITHKSINHTSKEIKITKHSPDYSHDVDYNNNNKTVSCLVHF